jgi:exodeoxyribonuclease-3
MKLLNWNVNGVRASATKGFVNSILPLKADVICLQETKATPEQVQDALKDMKGYHVFANSAERKGYSGTAILSKTQPLDVVMGIGLPEHDTEGRVITAEFADFFLVTVYTPNSGSELARIPYRKQWDADFLAYCKGLEKKKPVVICGDLNVAHKPIDLARPKDNYNKTAGYTQSEIDGMDTLQGAGFVDTFRLLHPETVKYSWWSQRFGARQKNVGWRIDYFLVSESLKGKVKGADILTDVMGSDHCPVVLELA